MHLPLLISIVTRIRAGSTVHDPNAAVQSSDVDDWLLALVEVAAVVAVVVFVVRVVVVQVEHLVGPHGPDGEDEVG